MRRAEDDRHVDRRERIGQHDIDRQPDQRPDLRHDDLDPGDSVAVAQGASHGEIAPNVDLAESREDDEQEKGHFLDDQPDHERHPGPVIDRGEVGRAIPSERARDRAGDPAGRRQQKGEADRHRGVGRGEKRREQPGAPLRRHPRLHGRAERRRQDQRDQGRADAGHQGQPKAGPEARQRRQHVPRRKRRAVMAEGWKDTEGGLGGLTQAGENRQDQAEHGHAEDGAAQPAALGRHRV